MSQTSACSIALSHNNLLIHLLFPYRLPPHSPQRHSNCPIWKQPFSDPESPFSYHPIFLFSALLLNTFKEQCRLALLTSHHILIPWSTARWCLPHLHTHTHTLLRPLSLQPPMSFWSPNPRRHICVIILFAFSVECYIVNPSLFIETLPSLGSEDTVLY